jgi:hypothetical protein
MGPALREALVGQDAGDSFEEFVRGRSAYLFRLALLLTGRTGRRPRTWCRSRWSVLTGGEHC